MNEQQRNVIEALIFKTMDLQRSLLDITGTDYQGPLKEVIDARDMLNAQRVWTDADEIAQQIGDRL
jgi:hypothetical protein